MILLLGGTGYVGTAFCQMLNAREIPFRNVSRRDVDYTRLDCLIQLLREVQPQFLINCAGYTGKPNVDACELHKAECLDGNAVLPGTIRHACEQFEIPWGHVSSGCIFTGKRDDGGGFTESDPPNFSFRTNNCSFYSGTKALGEEVLADAANCYVWRLRIPFSRVDSPRNYLTKVMQYDRLLQAENSLSHLPEFVAACFACFEKSVPYGLYNVTNPGSVTTGRVVELIQEAGLSDKQFQFFDSESEFMNVAAKTPRSNCVLDSSKALAAGLHLSPVEDVIRHALANWQSNTGGLAPGRFHI